jgi:phosphoglycolate phosphatase-like HAD superfamily hydrolase
MPPRAIIFDFDGVILDSVGVKTKAFAQLVEAHGLEAVRKMVAYHEANGGVSRYRKFEWFYREVLGRELLEDESREMGDRFENLAFEGVLAAQFIPGAQEFLAVHSAAIPFFVASGTPQDELVRIVQKRGLARYFHEVHGSPAVKSDIVRDILKRYAFVPGEVLFVGDAMTDFEAAQECGLKFVGVASDGAGPFPEGTRVIADLREMEGCMEHGARSVE